jgi:hypothetical protein
MKIDTLRYINSAAGSFRPINPGLEIFDKCATSPMVAPMDAPAVTGMSAILTFLFA